VLVLASVLVPVLVPVLVLASVLVLVLVLASVLVLVLVLVLEGVVEVDLRMQVAVVVAPGRHWKYQSLSLVHVQPATQVWTWISNQWGRGKMGFRAYRCTRPIDATACKWSC
jgi:hypothetical protein